MKNNDALLDYIYTHCSLDYLSDIRYPQYLYECLPCIREIAIDDFSLQQWQYLYEYITGDVSTDTEIIAIQKRISSWCQHV